MAIDAQAKIDLLEATYNSLAADNMSSRSAADRSHTLLKMSEVRTEIDYWEKRRDAASRSSRTFTQGRPVR